MDHDTLIAIFVIIAAVAIVIQMCILLGMFLVARKLRGPMLTLTREAKQNMDRVVQAAMEIFTSSREPIKAVAANAAEVSRIARDRTVLIDQTVGEISERTRLQAIRIDGVITGLVDRVETTATTVQRNVIGPLVEVGAIVKGVQSGIDYFFSRRQRSSAREARQDEEMFI